MQTPQVAVPTTAFASSAFASLTPYNFHAKVAFHEVYDYYLQSSGEGALYCAVIDDQPVFDREVYHEQLARKRSNNPDGYISDTPTDPDTDLEDEEQASLGSIWKGQYVFSLQLPPERPVNGWMVGKGRPDQGLHADIQLTLNKPFYDVRGFHAAFNLHAGTGFMWVSRASKSHGIELTVNGEDVPRGQRYALNRTPMTIRFGRCEYVFEYTDFARTSAFQIEQRNYLTRFLNIPNESIHLSYTPTPNPRARTVGEWTLGPSLGKGTFGRVFVGTNARNEIVAIKVIERAQGGRSSTHPEVVAEQISVLRKLKDLCDIQNDEGRLVQLKDIIYQNGEEEFDPRRQGRFEEVALVLTPAVKGNFSTLIDSAKRRHLGTPGITSGMLEDAESLFYDAIKGLAFLHRNYWLHGDIKPENIGINGDRAVLLDIDTCVELRPGYLRRATPGAGGTVNYLAPERELRDYDHTVDVWALGVIGYELLFGAHPFKFNLNPWRPGPTFEHKRPEFQHQYTKSMDRLRNCESIDGSQYSPGSLISRALKAFFYIFKMSY